MRLHALERGAEEPEDEDEPEHSADDAAVGEDLQIVVVRLLKTVVAVRCVIARIGRAERAEPRACQRVVFDYPDGAAPEVRAPRGRVCGIDRAEQSRDGLVAAKVQNAEEDRD